MINETLHTFISVTKNGSFNKAAEKLSLTAPAVMKQMNSLEKASVPLSLSGRTAVSASHRQENLFERCQNHPPVHKKIHRARADRRRTNSSSADMRRTEGGLCPSCRPPHWQGRKEPA